MGVVSNGWRRSALLTAPSLPVPSLALFLALAVVTLAFLPTRAVRPLAFLLALPLVALACLFALPLLAIRPLLIRLHIKLQCSEFHDSPRRAYCGSARRALDRLVQPGRMGTARANSIP
jgi:hypothetical protein